MLLVSTDWISGRELETISLVSGSAVQSKQIKDITSSLQSFMGGELDGYTDILDQTTRLATTRMSDKAEALGADAVVDIKISAANIASGAVQVIVYGTAVHFVPDRSE